MNFKEIDQHLEMYGNYQISIESVGQIAEYDYKLSGSNYYYKTQKHKNTYHVLYIRNTGSTTVNNACLWKHPKKINIYRFHSGTVTTIQITKLSYNSKNI